MNHDSDSGLCDGLLIFSFAAKSSNGVVKTAYEWASIL
jgi:hypothetical protein